MFDVAVTQLSPILSEGYRALLTRELADSPELDELHKQYIAYSQLDRIFPRPLLTYFGYHALSESVPFDDLEEVGEAIFLPQLFRDVLAVHDDIVDEDTEKFGHAPLPVMFSAPSAELSLRGKNVALFYGDLLLGVVLRVISRLPDAQAGRLTRLLADTFYINQRGQTEELLREVEPITSTTLDDVLVIGERKAAYYCYVFPFAVGLTLKGHDPQDFSDTLTLLRDIGTTSQVIDDITGALPGLLDHDKDTLGEIIHLRRTVPLTILAHDPECPPQICTILTSTPPISSEEAHHVRDYLGSKRVLRQLQNVCDERIARIQEDFSSISLGDSATRYVRDLITTRLVEKVKPLSITR